jgi:hypothetical protein
MSKISQTVMIGLPETGKTTYLAALWHVLDTNEVKDSLVLKKFSGDMQYLNEIRAHWLSCTPIPRTSITNEKHINLILADPKLNDSINFYIPDFSGETYENQWGKRQWSKEYKELITACDGIMLFIHPEKVREPKRINQASKIISELSSVQDSYNNSSITNMAKIQEENSLEQNWTHRFAPTQVKLIDLLQFLIHSKDIPNKFNLAIIISAWDLLNGHYNCPNVFIMERLPLLHQFIHSNQDKFSTQIYGISAQGGKLDDKDNLVKLTKQSERISVIVNGTNSNDITLPLKWLIDCL